jgi:hypothetical protein
MAAVSTGRVGNDEEKGRERKRKEKGKERQEIKRAVSLAPSGVKSTARLKRAVAYLAASVP